MVRIVEQETSQRRAPAIISPGRKARLLGISSQHKPITPLTEAQVFLSLDTVAGKRLATLYELAIWLGLRESELIGLRWADIHLDKGALKVAGQMLRRRQENGKTKLGRYPTKSKKVSG